MPRLRRQKTVGGRLIPTYGLIGGATLAVNATYGHSLSRVASWRSFRSTEWTKLISYEPWHRDSVILGLLWSSSLVQLSDANPFELRTQDSELPGKRGYHIMLTIGTNFAPIFPKAASFSV
ncbi:hypothetical protein VFPPC_17489 [Pochonia chlamydosporia 170]|uniref:Uncharacterized protein n=1 Tax=Pochonia chlamydosporia 170 TaxID=1380566 RepID=A0A219ARE0_METCM|nr:hypothetical protein VFPPC_17489 [Pochonia chlamydosporia 170]OWT43348.1 hypothetical protein VFPPC_17489 [Pochonia chlamydosporia 170]